MTTKLQNTAIKLAKNFLQFYISAKQFMQTNKIFCALTFLFVSLRLNFVVLQDVFVPDELWHTAYMQSSKIKNYEGFGAVFWIFGRIIYFIFSSYYLFVLRFLALVAIAISGWYCYKIIQLNKALFNNKKLVSLLLLVFYSSPFFWYTGKIITPEFYLFPIIFYAYYEIILYKGESKKAWLMLGLSVGIKSTAIMATFPIGIYSFFLLKKDALLSKANLSR
ncbi:MAG: hypothetical protein P8P83_03050 [Rickettsiaceae bacterium]|nr:hypothetical protein [Rickettsiaceae bacterium]